MRTYYILRFSSWLARFVPERWAYRLCAVIGYVVFYANRPMREAVGSNLRRVLPGTTRRERRVIARKVIAHNFENHYELVRLPHLNASDLERKIKVVGVEHLLRAHEQGKGLIVLSGHIGNFNLAAQIAVVGNFPVALVTETIKPPRLDSYVQKLRSHFGLTLIKTGSSSIRTVYRFLRGGGALALAADHVVGEGVSVPFFGSPARLPAGPVTLALRLDLPIVPFYIVRMPDRTSKLTILEAWEMTRTGNTDEDVKANLRKVAAFLEDVICKHPDQWIVLQRVWE